MPPRLERRQQTGNAHFITFSCDQENDYLQTPESKDIFLEVLESRRQMYGFLVFGYVVMPNHVHLLLSEPRVEPLSKAIASIKREVSRQHEGSPFWLARYHDFNVFRRGRKMIEKLRYIHRNPLKRGLVDKTEEYRWSSFRAYASAEESPVFITRYYEE